VDRQRILEREHAWATPAATAAVLAFALYIASFVIDRSANLYTGASDARQLISIHDHSSTVLFSSIVRALTFLLLPLPLLYLFRAAQARNPRVQAVMLGFVFIGPILFAVQGIVQAKGASDTSSEFATLAPEPQRPYAKFQRQVKQNPKSIDKVTIYTATHALEVQQADGKFYTVPKYPASAESGISSELQGASPSIDHDTNTDADSRPGDARAVDLTDSSSSIQVAQALLFPAVLGLVVMMIYVPLQALRAGLLTRFFGSLGVALGASMIIILPVALLASLIWIGYLGLLFVGRVPGGRPPAWEAGEAIPWPRPGDEAPAQPKPADDAIEGEATEVPGEEAAEAPDAPQQPPRQKRKRRR